VSGQLHSPDALLQGKEPPVAIGWETEWATELVWTWWRKGKFPTPTRNQTPQTPTVQSIASHYID